MAKKKEPAAFVLDGLVTLAWCFPDDKEPYAQAVRDCLSWSTVFVPSLWHLEIANALLMSEGRKRSTEADTAR